MTTIYEPKGRAREYAALATNVYTRCDHGCLYCYVPGATRQSREIFIKPTLRNGYLTNLEKDACKLSSTGNPIDQILLCFACDPYQAFEVSQGITRQSLKILNKHDLNFCILSKGGSRALRDIDLYKPGDSFASTLTFVDDDKSLYREPGASLPNDRISTIQEFHKSGIETWVSLEPVIEPKQSIESIYRTADFVDLYKVGRMNHHIVGNEIDWRKFGIEATELLESIGKHYYVKQDLAKEMPASSLTGEHRLTQRQIELAHRRIPYTIQKQLF